MARQAAYLEARWPCGGVVRAGGKRRGRRAGYEERQRTLHGLAISSMLNSTQPALGRIDLAPHIAPPQLPEACAAHLLALGHEVDAARQLVDHGVARLHQRLLHAAGGWATRWNIESHMRPISNIQACGASPAGCRHGGVSTPCPNYNSIQPPSSTCSSTRHATTCELSPPTCSVSARLAYSAAGMCES